MKSPVHIACFEDDGPPGVPLQVTTIQLSGTEVRFEPRLPCLAVDQLPPPFRLAEVKVPIAQHLLGPSVPSDPTSRRAIGVKVKPCDGLSGRSAHDHPPPGDSVEEEGFIMQSARPKTVDVEPVSTPAPPDTSVKIDNDIAPRPQIPAGASSIQLTALPVAIQSENAIVAPGPVTPMALAVFHALLDTAVGTHPILKRPAMIAVLSGQITPLFPWKYLQLGRRCPSPIGDMAPPPKAVTQRKDRKTSQASGDDKEEEGGALPIPWTQGEQATDAGSQGTDRNEPKRFHRPYSVVSIAPWQGQAATLSNRYRLRARSRAIRSPAMTKLTFTTHRFYELSLDQLYDIMCLRDLVFVVGQKVTAVQEVDGEDRGYHHVCGWDEAGALKAYARVSYDETPAKVGRVAVHPDLQRTGLGSQLMGVIQADLGDHPAAMHAQAHLEAWYSGLGWQREGEIFMEAEIPHVFMVWPAKP